MSWKVLVFVKEVFTELMCCMLERYDCNSMAKVTGIRWRKSLQRIRLALEIKERSEGSF